MHRTRREFQTEYQELRCLKEITHPAAVSGGTRLAEKFEYDKLGRIKKYIDTANRETLYNYNDPTRTNTVTNAEGEVTTTKYNQRFQTTELKDAINQTYTFAYDPLGRLLSQTRAGGTMSFQYDEVGNRKKRTDYAGRVTNYTYDNLNRLTKIVYGDPVAAGAPPNAEAAYGYDDISRLTSAVNEAGTVGFTYDNRNRLKTETDVFGQVLEFGYDAASNRAQLKLNGSVHTSYTYDDANRLTTLTDEASQNFTFGYDIADRMTSRTMPNGVTSTFEYDGMSRLTRLKHQSSTATLFDNQYAYNSANQISQITDLANTRLFGYDLVDRLTSVHTNGTQTESYTFDDVGNRTTSHLSATYGYQSGKFNQLASTATATMQYDANGNIIRKSEGSQFWRYVWDQENRLTEAATRKQKVRYRYDAVGRRVERNFGFKERTKFTHDGLDVVMDDDKNTGLTKYQNGLGIDDKLKVSSSAASSYFLQDHLGSTLGLANSSATVTSSSSYDSFGNPTDTLASRYQFTGREFDNFTGLQFSRARFYAPALGRFISEDPIGFGGGDINLYGYVWNRPNALIDPMGLDGWGNDFADYLDERIEYARRFYQRDVQRWKWNGTVNTVADVSFACADMFRVGRGIGYAMYAPDENGYGRGAAVAMDIVRAAGIFTTLAGPVAGRTGAGGNRPFIPDEWYNNRLNHRAPSSGQPFGVYERFDTSGNIHQVTTYDQFGSRIRQYDLGPNSRHGEGVHTFEYNQKFPRQQSGGGIRSPQSPF